LLRAAVAAGITVAEVVENPTATAERLGRQISESSAANLRRVAPSRLSEIQDPADRELITFMYKVLEDGRFVRTWITEPARVAAALEVTLSPPVIDRIIVISATRSFAADDSAATAEGAEPAIATTPGRTACHERATPRHTVGSRNESAPAGHLTRACADPGCLERHK
jgi:hypothetical protein